MYVTRPLSMYRKSPSTMSIPTPDAPFSGYLVITDEEAEAEASYCWGLCKRKRVKKFPFPQDKIFTLYHSSSEYEETTASTKVWFVPVLDRPLSSNRYYIIKAKGKHKGKAYRCSREEDIMTCCFKNILNDKAPKPFNLKDIYQQFKIHSHPTGGFFAKSVAPDGIPPKFLRTKGWKINISSTSYSHHKYPKLGDNQEALGLDTALRTQLPDFSFPVFTKRSRGVVVGKWHCPFMFVKERLRLKTQVKKTMFYTITLEQWWEEIYSCCNVNSENRIVRIDVDVMREVFLVGGREAVRLDEEESSKGGFVWFGVDGENGGGREGKVGLSVAMVEKMRWVQEEGGWFNGGEREVRVEREEVYDSRSESGWERFSCYMLVESFALRRRDGSLVWKCNFMHDHRINCKWD